MKWLIASDIHGSAHYCRLLLECYKKEKADRLVLLGDVLYHGPRNDLPEEYAPKKVTVMLNEMKEEILCVRGNCDTEVDQMVLDFPILADYAVFDIGSRMIYATHGHIYNEEKLPPIHSGSILLYGHTHIPSCVEHKSCVCMNPGSVSIPKGNSYHGYMTLENGMFLWKDLDGNIKREYVIRG
jgi:hypothetical protein